LQEFHIKFSPFLNTFNIYNSESSALYGAIFYLEEKLYYSILSLPSKKYQSNRLFNYQLTQSFSGEQVKDIKNFNRVFSNLQPGT